MCLVLTEKKENQYIFGKNINLSTLLLHFLVCLTFSIFSDSFLQRKEGGLTTILQGESLIFFLPVIPAILNHIRWLMWFKTHHLESEIETVCHKHPRRIQLLLNDYEQLSHRDGEPCVTFFLHKLAFGISDCDVGLCRDLTVKTSHSSNQR